MSIHSSAIHENEKISSQDIKCEQPGNNQDNTISDVFESTPPSDCSEDLIQIEVIQGDQGKYYVSYGHKYHHTFPLEWALDPEYNPGTCCLCIDEGKIRGVFVKYCAECQNWFNGSRGTPDRIDLAIFPTSSIQKWIDNQWYLFGEKYRDIGDEEEEYEDLSPKNYNYGNRFDAAWSEDSEIDYEMDMILPY